MKNFVQSGFIVPVPAPAGGAVSGKGVLIGALFGVAAASADAGLPVEIATQGVFDLDKVSADAFSLGAPVYWDATAKACTVEDEGNTRIGAALVTAGAGATIVRVRLNGATG